jgi:hypothetical protein
LPPPSLELVVVGPGEDDFTLYGHAAIRVVAAAELNADGSVPDRVGQLFNFGITDFRKPGYIKAFAGGTVRFWGDVGPYRGDLLKWTAADRTVERHPLQLSPEQARCAHERMLRDVTEDHREFTYDTFRENCATRLRDLLDECTAGAVFAGIGDAPGSRTFRDDVRHAYAGRPALLLFSDLIPGLPFDEARSLWHLSYRPEALAVGLSEVQLTGPEGKRPLLGPVQVDHRRTGADPRNGKPRRGAIFLYVLAVLVLLVAALAPKLPERMRGAILILLTLVGAAHGALLWTLSVATEWPDMRGTALMLFFMPFDVLLLWPAIRALFTGTARPSGLFGTWLKLRIAAGLLVWLASAFFEPLGGPGSGRALALAGLLLAMGCLGQPAWPPRWLFRRGAKPTTQSTQSRGVRAA